MADDRVIQIAVTPGAQEFPDEVYLLYQSGEVFHGSLSEEPTASLRGILAGQGGRND
jgi:hypothetical protein